MKNNSSQYDKMMNTPITSLLISLAIPTVMTMMVTNVYNVVDTAFVGQIGTSASGAVGIVFGFMGILQAIGFTFGQGSGSIISRMLGAREVEKASRVASSAFFFSFIIAAFTGVVCWICLDGLVVILGSTATIAPYAKTYIRYIIATGPCMVTGFTLNNILRYEGKATLGMIGMLSGAILNIAGDMLFMFVFDMGIAGAGLSTALSQAISFAILVSVFVMGKTQTKISFKYVIWNFRENMDIVATGFPSMLRQGLMSITTILLNMKASAFGGDAGVAGMSIVSRLFFFVFAVAIGVGQGFQPVSGFSFGAKRYDRLKEAYKTAAVISEGLMIVFGTLMFIFAPQLVQWLRNDPEVIEIGVRALRIQCVALLVLPFSMMTEMLMQSTGQKLMAIILSSIRNGLVFIPCLYIMSYFRGMKGIEEAQPISFFLAFPIAVIVAKMFFNKYGTENKSEVQIGEEDV